VNWRATLNGNPLPWLLEPDPDNPAVRYFALRDLLGRPEDDPEVREARAAVMRTGPVPAILYHRNPEGWWAKPGHGYSPKYTATTWQLLLLADLGASGDERILASCDYVLSHAQARSGGMAFQGRPSGVVHCLNGNLTHAFLSLGVSHRDERLRAALEWEARAILGEGVQYYKSGTTGPGFGCAINWSLPCAWGAVKALRALALVPPRSRTLLMRRAVDTGAEFMLAYDLAKADYPHEEKISPHWFKFGYPLGYTSDILEALDVLAALGRARDPRLAPAIEFVLSKQDRDGRWKLQNSLNGKTWVDIERRGMPSKWVTLRALRALKAAAR
jgi:hypothetical protein